MPFRLHALAESDKRLDPSSAAYIANYALETLKFNPVAMVSFEHPNASGLSQPLLGVV